VEGRFSLSAKRLSASRMIWIIPSPSFCFRLSMRCRSESEKRTVVDLSFSLFMAVHCCIRMIGPSLPKSTEEAVRQLGDISQVSICEVFFSEHRAAISNRDV
jgi:hypothetical protein